MKNDSEHLMQRVTAVCLVWFWALLSAPGFSATDTGYSLVINNGRVMDPETGLDEVRHLGIRDGHIAILSDVPLTGLDTIDASGLVVAPGFIDLHTHSPTELGQYYQLFDGVTTALELEVGSYPVAAYAAEISDHALINFGASAGYLSMRMLEKNGLEANGVSGTPRPVGLLGWWTALKFYLTGLEKALAPTLTEAATDEELTILRASLHEGLDRGGLGIGLPLDYFSEAASKQEVALIFEVAGERRAPVFVHIRRGRNGDPAGLREVVTLAERFDTPVHVCHISHNAMRNIGQFLAIIRHARDRGVDITTEVLPFNAGSTVISAAVFGRDWQRIFDISYQDVEWAATGERLTEETFDAYRANQPQGAVIHHYLKDEWTQRALREPGIAVVSDLVPMKSLDIGVPPHNSAFSRVLGYYVRELQVIDLMTAITSMTLVPARRLESYVPQFARKGRVQQGMDADLTVFDPATIAPRATYREPYREAAGLHHVIVNGQVVVEAGELAPGVHPGRRLLATDG